MTFGEAIQQYGFKEAVRLLKATLAKRTPTKGTR